MTARLQPASMFPTFSHSALEVNKTIFSKGSFSHFLHFIFQTMKIVNFALLLVGLVLAADNQQIFFDDLAAAEGGECTPLDIETSTNAPSTCKMVVRLSKNNNIVTSLFV